MGESRERRRDRAWRVQTQILHYQKLMGTFSIKEEKNRGTNPEVNKRLHLGTFFGSPAPSR